MQYSPYTNNARIQAIDDEFNTFSIGGGQGYQNPSGGLPGPRDVMDAIQNTGGGGGAFHGPAGDLDSAGKGGSGIVLIAYPT